MKFRFIVVDANVFVSALLKNSFTRKLLLSENVPELFSPDFVKEEVLKYSKDFAEKLEISEEEIKVELENIFELANAKFVEKDLYAEKMKYAVIISPDLKDAPYFALALKLDCPIWSQDKALKKQKQLKIVNTTELSKELES